jgi:hypothetical protein
VRQTFSSTNPNRQANDYIHSAGVSGKGNNPRDGGHIKRQKYIYHHSPRPIPIICHLPDSPCFLLITNLKVHKIDNFFGSDFEFCVISFLVMLK